MKFKYTGDGPIDVPALGLVDVTSNRHVEVDDPEISAGMKGSENWEHIPDPKRSKAAKQAAATRAEDTTDDAVKES